MTAPIATPATEALVLLLRFMARHEHKDGSKRDADTLSAAAAELSRLRHALAEAEAREKAAVEAERERCAQVCEARAREFLSEEYAYPQPIGSITERFACNQCAAAIRDTP